MKKGRNIAVVQGLNVPRRLKGSEISSSQEITVIYESCINLSIYHSYYTFQGLFHIAVEVFEVPYLLYLVQHNIIY